MRKTSRLARSATTPCLAWTDFLGRYGLDAFQPLHRALDEAVLLYRVFGIVHAPYPSTLFVLMAIPHINRWPNLGKFWTFPNVLSIARLLLVAPITMLLWHDGPLDWLFGLVIVAIFTDWFDGRVARWSNTESEWGKVLDPIADKVGAVATVSALTFRATEPTLPPWFFGALMSRDFLIVAGSLLIVRRSGKVAASVWAGKAATFWLAITVLAAVLKADPPVLAFCVWMTTALLVFSFFVYLVRYLNAARREPPMPNPPSLQGVRSKAVGTSSASLPGEPPELDMVEEPESDLTDTAGRTGDGEPGPSPETPSSMDDAAESSARTEAPPHSS